MKSKIKLFSVLILGIFCQAKYLRVERKILKSSNGLPIILKGINYPILDDGDVDFNKPITYQTKITEFAKTGAIIIRLP